MGEQFGKRKLIKDISANTLQIAIIQFFSLAVFYFTSRFLPKNDFGELNWSTAVAATIIALASLGLDVVLIKRVASGQNALVYSGVHFFHTIVVAIVLGFFTLLLRLFFPSFEIHHPLFFLVFVNLSLLNIGNSFKLSLTGLEAYKSLAKLAFISNTFKMLLILLLYVEGKFTIYSVVYIYLFTTAIEFILGYYFLKKKLSTQIKPVLNLYHYKNFIFESLPQLGVVFFDSALARLDWILLGIISTASITADYSFAYRMYESSKLPIFVIAPILLTRFSKLFVDPTQMNSSRKNDILIFFKLELFLVTIIPVVLICVWTPLIDYISDGKYGAVNALTYTILAACVPLQCITNFLWSLGFVQGQLKSIMFITIGTALLNLLINLILIPYAGSNGAAIAFLISTLVQTLLYARYMSQSEIKLDKKACVLALVNAIVAVVAAKILTNNVIFAGSIAVTVLTVLAVLTKQINYYQIKKIIKPR
jgi:O-antigen/teichoic acid export membrane protein